LENFGSNPGALNAWSFAPEGKAKGLVVVLHGCTQTAAGYDSGSGWSKLAEDYGFAVLFPEQRRTNNPNVCFNWFEPGDTRRGAGEAASIAQMIEAVIERHGIDPRRVFITGLSAGGAMTSVMLAAYPELFAGGAILAGLPHGAAASIPEAFQQMRAPSPSNRTSGQAIKSASPHPGPWPTVAIWHGTADTVVSPSNAGAILGQWQEVHGLESDPSEEREVDGHPYRAWRDGAGKVVLEEYRVKGMGHGTPLATGGECGCGEAGAFMLEAGISATVHSAKSWGLLDKRAKAQARPATRASVAAGVQAVPDRRPAPDRITRVIEDALRAAGLMK
jgi:poly(hydroxyalkanoate) depolymerase family esterase